MHIKSFIIGLFLLCLGGGSLWWVHSERQRQEQEAEQFKQKYSSEASEYNKKWQEWMLLPPEERSELPAGLDINANKTPEQIFQVQQERLKADMDKLAAGEMTVYPFADEFYGPGWQEKIVKYKEQKEWSEFLFNCSIVCASFGGLITGWIILFNLARLLIKIVNKLKQSITSIAKKQEHPESPENSDKDTDTEKDDQHKHDDNFKNLSNVLINSGWQYAGSFGNEQKSGARQRKRIPLKNRSQSENANSEQLKESAEAKVFGAEENIIQKPDDKERIDSENITESETVITNNVDFTNAKGHTHLIDNTLKDLTQQVSAIREYAANQQNRLERFQDGYDWNIIKTFCLRIIRCIDNIENRIDQLSEEEDCLVKHLEEIRDELVFALESSGIEQFEPEVNSDYRGQEKFAEAIKEKKQCKDPDKKGKIESVIKPGYQFYIDDENVKIVRPAQVRLFA